MADEAVRVSQQQTNPIKIKKWKIRQGTTVPIGRIILIYEEEVEEKQEQKKLKATQAGIIHKILAKEGNVVQHGEPLYEIKACSHPTIMNDMCAECGADLRKDDSPRTTASVPMIHAIPELKVSEEQAQKIGKADNDRLIKDRKLVLLVDLDQTLIHTTNDNIPPNIKDVYHFQLYGPKSPWYHTRLRPGTHKFLQSICEFYELHICTFGARNYAHMIAMFLDPEQMFFSNRILSRDECFDPTSKKANLRALFPCGDDMVCIIDDREDVWSHASNLIHVKPYHFFQHTGDINAPPGLDKQENDDKQGGVDLMEFVRQHSKEENVNQEEDVDKGNPKKIEEKVVEGEKINESNMEIGECLIPTEESQLNATTVQFTEPVEECKGRQGENEETNESNKEIVELSIKCVDNNVEDANSQAEGKKPKTPNGKEIDESSMKIVENNTGEEVIQAEENKQETTKIGESKVEPIIAKEENDKEITKNEDLIPISMANGIEEDTSTEVCDSKEINVKNENSVKESNQYNKGPIKENEEANVIENIDKEEEEAANETLPTINIEQNGKLKSVNNVPLTEQKAQIEDHLIEIEDPDDYLAYLEDILRRIHKAFYERFDKMQSGKIPDLKKIIPGVRENILKGYKLVFSGLVPTHYKLEQSKAYLVARGLGAEVQADLDDETTHLVAVRPGTAKVNAGRRKKNLRIVTSDWLWCCAERWEHVDERIFPLNSKGSRKRHPPPHCSSPEHVTSYPEHDTPALRKRTPSGRFMDTINPLMSFSSDDIADMDKEVEDILDDESDDSEEEQQVAAQADNELEEENDTDLEEVNFKHMIQTEILATYDHHDLDIGLQETTKECETEEELDRVNAEEESPKRKRILQDDESSQDLPSRKFRRGERVDHELDVESEDPDENDSDSFGAPESDDGEWNMMGAALEREFLTD